MERQHLSQGKKAICLQQRFAIASSNRESATARYSTHPIEELQGAIGNRAVNQLLANQPTLQAKPLFRGLSHELVVQPKLTIGAVGDKYEQEADRVVDWIHAPQAQHSIQDETTQRAIGDSSRLIQQSTAGKNLIQRHPDPRHALGLLKDKRWQEAKDETQTSDFQNLDNPHISKLGHWLKGASELENIKERAKRQLEKHGGKYTPDYMGNKIIEIANDAFNKIPVDLNDATVRANHPDLLRIARKTAKYLAARIAPDILTTGVWQSDLVDLTDQTYLQTGAWQVGQLGQKTTMLQALKPTAIAIDYLNNLNQVNLTELHNAHTALAVGNLVNADANFVTLKTNLGAIADILKTRLLRYHMGAGNISNQISSLLDERYLADENTQKRGKEKAESQFSQEYAQGNTTTTDWHRAKTRVADATKKPEYQALTYPEVLAIVAYTGSGYQNMNPTLRTLDPQKITANIDTIATLVSGLRKLKPYIGTVYRHAGIYPGINELYQPGAVVSDLAFTSAARTPRGTVESAQGHDVLFVMASKSGRSIEDISYNTFKEQEVLFPPGVQFKVTKRVSKNLITGVLAPNDPEARNELAHADNAQCSLAIFMVEI